MATKINKVLTSQKQKLTQEELGNVSASLSAILGQGGGGGEPCASAWLPYVNSEGDLSWYLTMSTVAPPTANIMGPQGPSGAKGDQGEQGEQGPQGETGAQGPQGEPGVTPVFQINASTNFWEVSYDDGSTWTSLGTSATGPKGADGDDGDAGADGFSPTITLSAVTDASHNNGGTEVNITYKNGDATATATYTAWNGNDGSMAGAPDIVGNDGVSAALVGDTYNVGLSADFVKNTDLALNDNSQISAISGHELAGFSGLFQAMYGVTTYADVKTAVDDHQLVYCVTGQRMAFLTYSGTDNFEFQYYRSLKSKKLTAGDEVYCYKITTNSTTGTWSTETRKVTPQYIAGNGLSAAYKSDTLTFGVSAAYATSAGLDENIQYAMTTTGWEAITGGGLSEVSAVAPLSGDGSSAHPLGIDMSNAYSIDGAHGITAIPNTADNKVIVQMTDDVWAYYQHLAASANVWDSASAISTKSKTVINSAVNTITTENNGNSATLSAVEYKVNTSFQNAAAKQLFVVLDDNDIYAKLSEVNGKGSLFFVCSAI